MHKKTELICGKSDIIPDFESIASNPNFVFENDPEFSSIRLFDIENNVVNVNSWLECANYVNGGWTNNQFDFFNGENILFFLISFSFTAYLLIKNYYLGTKNETTES